MGIQFRIVTLSHFSNVHSFAQVNAETVNFLTACCLHWGVTWQLRFSTVSWFQNVHQIREYPWKPELVLVKYWDSYSLKLPKNKFCYHVWIILLYFEMLFSVHSNDSDLNAHIYRYGFHSIVKIDAFKALCIICETPCLFRLHVKI